MSKRHIIVPMSCGRLHFSLGAAPIMRLARIGPAYDRNCTSVFLFVGPLFGLFIWWHGRHDARIGRAA